jgi:CubicO group peptidase (beta-lactamase class C family)
MKSRNKQISSGAIIKRCFGLTVIALFLGLGFNLKAVTDNDFPTRADASMKELVERERFSGSVLVAQSGKILFEKGYGLANREWDIPNSPRTKFRIGSLTKQFTAVAILLLQEQGKLKVTDAIARYVTGLPPEWRQITIHQLLTHTAGLPEYSPPPENDKAINFTGASPEQLLNRIKPQPLKYAPGTKFGYCNAGYLLLGMVIEKVSGLDYASFLKQSVLTTLQLNDTGYDVLSNILPERATGYWIKNGKPENAEYFDASVPYAAGGLYSTVRDLYQWSEAIATGRLLSADSLQRMFAIYPETSINGAHYGYGVVITERFGQSLYYHGGGINGFATAIQRYPKSNLCVVVLSNEDEVKSWDVATGLAGLLLAK